VCQPFRNSQQAEATWSADHRPRFTDQGTISYRPYSILDLSVWRACVHGADSKTGTTWYADGSCVAHSQAATGWTRWCTGVKQLSVLHGVFGRLCCCYEDKTGPPPSRVTAAACLGSMQCCLELCLHMMPVVLDASCACMYTDFADAVSVLPS
jgi:hypothetical protein